MPRRFNPSMLGKLKVLRGQSWYSSASAGGGGGDTSCDFTYCYGGDWVEGKVGNYGVKFISSDSPKNYIDINNYSDIHALQKGTVAMWVNPNISGEYYPTLVAAGDNAVSDTYFEFYINQTDSKVKYAHYNAGDCGTNILNNTAITPNTWNHVALTSDGTTAKIYLNGVNNTATTYGYSNNGDWFADNSGLDNLTLGIMEYNGGTLSFPYSGSMDEIAIWDVPLTDAQISLLSTGSARADSITPPEVSPGVTGSLLMYYDFEIGDSNPVSGNFPTSTSVYDVVTASFHPSTAHTGTMTEMSVADFGQWGQGKIGKYAIEFTGSMLANTTGKGWLSASADANAAVGTLVDDFTIGGWFKFGGGAENDYCSMITNRGGGGPTGWTLTRAGSSGAGTAANKIGFLLQGGGYKYWHEDSQSGAEWVHIICGIDSGTPFIYKNGSAQSGEYGSGIVDISSGTPGIINFGRLQTEGTLDEWYASGSIDQVAIWDTVLDVTSITNLYNGTLPSAISSSNLQMYYDMECDGPGNSTVKDLSGNGYNLTRLPAGAEGSCG